MGLYSRIDDAVEDWEALAAPNRSAFSQERNGRPTDPAVFLNIYIVGYLENIADDTALAERSCLLIVAAQVGCNSNRAGVQSCAGWRGQVFESPAPG